MITFANGKTLESIAVYGSNMQYQDALRKTLEIICSPEVITLDEAKALWTDTTATGEITVTEIMKSDSGESDTTVQSVHLNFTLPVELKVDTEGVHIKLAQKSALEIMQEQHTADISALDAAILEIGELLGGESNG